mgnify:FL=1
MARPGGLRKNNQMSTSTIKQNNKSLPLAGGLRRPLVTEKTTDGISAKRPVYTFVVGPTANKFMIRRAIVEQYKVTPTKINISVVKPKKVFTRGRVGSRGGFKKAMVYLKPGDKIEL